MTPTDMEDAIRNLDQRLAATERILPTLAARQDVDRFATRGNLTEAAVRLEAHMEDLRAQVRTLAEGVVCLGNDVRRVAEALAQLSTDMTAGFQALTARLDRNGLL